jgi:hypothetical protein
VEFISCHYKKSEPKVHVSICKACKRRRSCDDYSRYRQPLLFPDLTFPDVKRTRKRKTYTKPAEPTKKQEQLDMGKLFDRA